MRTWNRVGIGGMSVELAVPPAGPGAQVDLRRGGNALRRQEPQGLGVTPSRPLWS